MLIAIDLVLAVAVSTAVLVSMWRRNQTQASVLAIAVLAVWIGAAIAITASGASLDQPIPFVLHGMLFAVAGLVLHKTWRRGALRAAAFVGVALIVAGGLAGMTRPIWDRDNVNAERTARRAQERRDLMDAVRRRNGGFLNESERDAALEEHFYREAQDRLEAQRQAQRDAEIKARAYRRAVEEDSGK